MISLLAAILFGAAFSHLLRYGQHRRLNMLWVGPANYWTAAAVSLVFWRAAPHPPVGSTEVLFGLVAGVALCSAYFLIITAIELAGVGLAQSVSRLSVAIPVAASIVIWGEHPGSTRVLGLALTFTAIPLLTLGQGLIGSELNKWKSLVLSGNFLAFGAVGAMMKAYAHALPGGEPAFLALMFLTAAVATQAIAWAKAGRPKGSDLLLGAAVGTANMISNYGIVHALSTLPGTVVFPTVSAGIIIFSSGCAALIWKERYTPLALMGMLLAVVAVILVNL